MGSYSTYTRRLRRKRKKEEMLGNPTIAYNFCNIPMSNLVATECNVQTPCKAKAPATKKGKPMCYDYDDCCSEQPTIENRQLTYFQNRVDSLQYNLRQDLRKMFHLDDDATPADGQSLIDRITSGKYILRTQEEMKHIYWIGGAISWFQWRDPAVKADEAGFELAEKELRKLCNKTTDIVTIGDAAQILAALDALEAFVPSNAPAVTA